MSYRRRKADNASLADALPKRPKLAAVSSIWLVGTFHFLGGFSFVRCQPAK
jgi:hypothetical protein